VGAQREARAVVERDPELQRAEQARIRSHLERRYGDRLAMYGVG
jgi:hypothetical protein